MSIVRIAAMRRIALALSFGAFAVLWSGDVVAPGRGLVAPAEAVVGRPATPVSYAGVARRSTVGRGGIGGPASGVGVLPGAGAGQVGLGYSGGVGVNLGGPVNRVGIR